MENSISQKTVGYVLRRFPVLSETFVLNEILELEAQGFSVHIFSLEKPKDPCFHQNLSRLKAQITYLPDVFNLKRLRRHQKKAHRKFGKTYRQTFRYVIRHMNPSLFLRFLQSCYIANACKKFSVSHLHAHFATRATTLAFLTSKIAQLPYSFTAHAVDIFKHSLSQKALKKKINEATFVITVSEYNKSYLEGLVSTAEHKLFKIYNGIDLDRFQPRDTPTQDPFIFLNVSRFVKKKGHHLLIEACCQLRDQGHQFQCWLIGKGILKSEIERTIKQKNLGDCIKVLGPHRQAEIIKRYHMSHAFVLPCTTAPNGDRDGLPVSIIEALACNLPVVTTPMTGNPEVIQDRYNGFLVPFDNTQAIAQAMRSLMCDKELFQTLRTNARFSVQDTFDHKKTSKSFGRLLEKSLGNGT